MKKILLAVLCLIIILTQNAFADSKSGIGDATYEEYKSGLHSPTWVTYTNPATFHGIEQGTDKNGNDYSRLVAFYPDKTWTQTREEIADFKGIRLGGSSARGTQVLSSIKKGYFVSPLYAENSIVEVNYNNFDNPFTEYAMPGYFFTGPRWMGLDDKIYVAGNRGGLSNLVGADKLYCIEISKSGKVKITVVADLPHTVYDSNLFFRAGNIAYIIAGNLSPEHGKTFKETIACDLGAKPIHCFKTGDAIAYKMNNYAMLHGLVIYSELEKAAYWIREIPGTPTSADMWKFDLNLSPGADRISQIGGTSSVYVNSALTIAEGLKLAFRSSGQVYIIKTPK